ncbi:fork head domain-containing protein FD5 [Adelges cooleyi]|uniref:fork head domain-containing protein FD5 n=1 Tax=Adelges cooleyi TaxID=133065 RepID=UPI002180688C|nr:fork head domain-containing protein FD5 [Adelges cooleyi]
MCNRPADDGPESDSQANLNRYRLHLYNYALQAERLRLSAGGWGAVCPVYPAAATGIYPPRFPVALFHPGGQNPDEPKPQHSYIGLIAMAILQSSEGKLVLSDIYQYILDNYPYFRTRGPGWRNSIRHNLSLNDCFVKAGRSANGKGHYWAIHPANVDDFKKGDFRRRKAQRKVRRHMGLAVDDDGNDSPSPPPPPSPSVAALSPAMWPSPPTIPPPFFFQPQPVQSVPTARPQKRQFDVASLLAPDPPKRQRTATGSSDEEDEARSWEPGLLQRYYEQQIQAAHRLHAFRQTLGLQRMIGPWPTVIVDRNQTPTPPPQQYTSPADDPIKTEMVD